MKARLASRWIVLGSLTAAIVLFFATRSGVAVDGNLDQISDIWALLYPTATNPTADSNGNGVNNRDESIWGANPLQSGGQSPATTTVILNPATGLLDSNAILQLVVWFEAAYQFQIKQDELNIDNLGSISAMADFLLSRKR